MEKQTLRLMLELLTLWMVVVDAISAANPGFKQHMKEKRLLVPGDDDDKFYSSGDRFSTLSPFDDEEQLIFEKEQFNMKSPTRVEVYVPDDENDSTNLDDVEKFDHFIQDMRPAMLQSNELDDYAGFGFEDDSFSSDCSVLSALGIYCPDENVEADEEPTTTVPVTIPPTKATTTQKDIDSNIDLTDFERDDFDSDCFALSVLGIHCADENVGAGEEPTTTVPVTIPPTKATTMQKEIDSSTDLTDKKTMSKNSSMVAQTIKPSVIEETTTSSTTATEQQRTITSSSAANDKITSTMKSQGPEKFFDVVMTSEDEGLVIPDVMPVTDDNDAIKPGTDQKKSTEEDDPEREFETTTKSTPRAASSAVTESQMKPDAAPQTSAQPDVKQENSKTAATQAFRSASSQPPKTQKIPMDVFPSAGADAATTFRPAKDEKHPMYNVPTAREDMVTTFQSAVDQEQSSGSAEPSAESLTTTSTPRSDDWTKQAEMRQSAEVTSKASVTEVTRMGEAVTEPHAPDKLPTKSNTDEPESSHAATLEINGIPEATTTESAVSPQKAQFSFVFLAVCIVSVLVLLVLIVIIVIVVRARLKRRGKYAITSEVDAGESAALAEGGDADVAKGNSEKVVTVQYNGPSA